MYDVVRHGNYCPFCDRASDAAFGNASDGKGVYEEAFIGDILPVKDPVVGWVVCIEGAAMGKDYRIISGRNFLGNSAKADIRIGGDTSIQGICAILTYEAGSTELFIAQAEDSRTSVEIENNEAKWVSLPGKQKINPGDKFKIGNSTFVFAPLCGKKDDKNHYGFSFDWPKDNVKEKN